MLPHCGHRINAEVFFAIHLSKSENVDKFPYNNTWSRAIDSAKITKQRLLDITRFRWVSAKFNEIELVKALRTHEAELPSGWRWFYNLKSTTQLEFYVYDRKDSKDTSCKGGQQCYFTED